MQGLTNGLEWTRDGRACLHFHTLGPAPLRPNVSIPVQSMDAGEQKTIADIDKYGCHVIHVMEEGELPPFAYSVGIEKTSQAAELIVIGLKQPLAHSIINEY